MDVEVKTWLFDILIPSTKLRASLVTDPKNLRPIKMILKREGLSKETLKLLVKR